MWDLGQFTVRKQANFKKTFCLLRRAAEQIQAGNVSGILNVGTKRTSTNSMGVVNKSRSYSLFPKGVNSSKSKLCCYCTSTSVTESFHSNILSEGL